MKNCSTFHQEMPNLLVIIIKFNYLKLLLIISHFDFAMFKVCIVISIVKFLHCIATNPAQHLTKNFALHLGLSWRDNDDNV